MKAKLKYKVAVDNSLRLPKVKDGINFLCNRSYIKRQWKRHQFWKEWM